MKKTKYAALLLILSVGLCQSPLCFGAEAGSIEITREVSDGVFSISGRVGTANAGVPVSLNVYPQGKNETDMENADKPSEVIVYHNETYTNDDGSYSFRLKLKKTSGIYRRM